jgi:hypothetical protein
MDPFLSVYQSSALRSTRLTCDLAVVKTSLSQGSERAPKFRIHHPVPDREDVAGYHILDDLNVASVKFAEARGLLVEQNFSCAAIPTLPLRVQLELHRLIRVLFASEDQNLVGNRLQLLIPSFELQQLEFHAGKGNRAP